MAFATRWDRSPRGALGPWRTGLQRHEWTPTRTTGQEDLQVGRPLAQAVRRTPAGGSDCDPDDPMATALASKRRQRRPKRIVLVPRRSW